MKNTKISDFWFYKFRYQISYTILFISYISIVLYTIFIAPNGLTQGEMESAQSSFNFSLTSIFSAEILNAPYKILQKISILAFGLNHFSIKLPSILLSIVSLFGIIKLTNKWFAPGVATLASIIALTSSQFFFLAQNGTSEILYILYPILILLIGANFISAPKKLPYIVMASIIAGISLYTPLSIYILLALYITITIHPHLRFIVKRAPKAYTAAALGTFLLIIAPLLIATIKDLSIIKTLLGLPDSWNILQNIQVLSSQLFSFNNESTNGIVSPIINLASVVLIGTGLFFTFSARWTSRSYLVNIWSVILFGVCLINPNATTILFTPILILTISGLQSLVQTWYTLFPQNPYARVAGLIPVFIVVVSLLLTNLDSFRLSYIYSPRILNNFSQDLKLLDHIDINTSSLVVSQNEYNFYNILSKTESVDVVTNLKASPEKAIVSKRALQEVQDNKDYEIKTIITSSRKTDSDRFYILEKI